MSESADTFGGPKTDPLLKEIYGKKKKKNTHKEMRKFSKIRNIIKKQKKDK